MRTTKGDRDRDKLRSLLLFLLGKSHVQRRGEKQWISRITLALKEDRFCLYAQKITSLKEDNTKEHYEILLRLLDEEDNLVPPMAFIPAAEHYNLMSAIDRWVIATFLAKYSQYCQEQTGQGLEVDSKNSNIIYTINLSGATIFSDRFLSFLQEQFTLYSISPRNICFEIPETIAISNLTKVTEFIQDLQQLGCLAALDDFGSGKSITYLKNLPVNFLKIDGNLIQNILNDPVASATLDCFNRIGHGMNMQTIAKFVENELIIDKLRQLGIDYAQGYAIGKPDPLSFKLN
ncbi:MAG: EAL domain-containing protein [Xenococcaceae cyanobacterium MO_188.B29]|nr:EAL domain-containing protein [Xenococcaceae cyanobacterium MO_188.B29]